MDVFNHRVSLEEAAAIVQAAIHRGLLQGANAAIFHHLGLMHSRIAGLQAAFPANTLHAVAVKANPVVEVLREAVQAGAGLEAASIEEVRLALAAGCAAERIVFDSPAKTYDEIRQSLQWGVHLNADSFAELERIAAVWVETSSTSHVGLRVNPMVGSGVIAHTSVADRRSKFGVPLDVDRQRIVAAFAKHAWLRGLHVHVGSQGCCLELLAEAARRIAALGDEIATATGRHIAFLDLGGGLSTVYRTGETAPTPAEYRALLEQQAPGLFVREMRWITEFGRAIQANCGIAIARVEYTKSLSHASLIAGERADASTGCRPSPGPLPEGVGFGIAQQMAVIHLGADFLLRPVYRPQDWQHEYFVLDRHGVAKTGTVEPVTLVGPLCFAGDILARDVFLPRIEPGDWVVIRDVGAYTLSMWSRHCSRGIPAVIGYDPGAAQPLRVLREAETPVDVVRFWSAPTVEA